MATDPTLPPPRGPITAWLFRHLLGEPAGPRPTTAVTDDAGRDEDVQLALYCCYELHYRGFRDVDIELEWDAEVLALRAQLESWLLADLVAAVGRPTSLRPDEAERRLLALATNEGGPSLSQMTQAAPRLGHMRELCIHRSMYQLKEADPHTWVIPRLTGEAKAATVEIQADEYGGGMTRSMHAELFADTLRTLGLDSSYGAYLAVVPGVTLATSNLISLFGLHRRWRGALIGHLALFEMTSVGPMGRYAEALAQLGIGPAGRRFYEVHVEADENHQRIALRRMVRGLLRDEPDLAGDVIFGATALVEVERRFSEQLLSRWADARPSLLPTPGPDGTPALSA